MTTEQKALALVNDCGGDVLVVIRNGNAWVEALCRSIEQHEAFEQKVSNIVNAYVRGSPNGPEHEWESLKSLIIPKPKPDPLVAAVHEVDTGPAWDSPEDYCNKIRAALDARGFEIREKGQ